MTGRHARLIVLSIVGLAVLITASCAPQAPRLEEFIDPEIAEAQFPLPSRKGGSPT